MKRHLVLLGAAFAISSGWAGSSKELRNGDFERIDETGRLVDWAYDARGAGQKNCVGRTGAALAVRPGAVRPAAQQRLKVVSGKCYKCSVWFRSEKGVTLGAKAVLRIVWEDQYGYALGASDSAGMEVATSGVWTELKKQVRVPALVDWANVRIESEGLLAGEILFDDVRFDPLN